MCVRVATNRQRHMNKSPCAETRRVVGCGLEKSKGSVSDQLKTIELPVIERNKCSRTINPSFRQFLRSDKFCAGFKNQCIGLCEGDSGGGLFIAKDSDSIKPVFCHNGQWSPAIPDCAAAANCPSINSTELWIYCSFAGAETFCNRPSRPGSIATVRCSPQYIRAERNLTCGGNGVWKWSGSSLKCCYDCGPLISDDDAAPWTLEVINKLTEVRGCYAAVINNVYLATNEKCMLMYKRNNTKAAVNVRGNDIRDVKPFEKEEYRFAFIKISPPLKFTKFFSPIWNI